MRMGFNRDEYDNVVLVMTQQDYDRLLIALGYAHSILGGPALANRLNAGNPNWTPYEVKE